MASSPHEDLSTLEILRGVSRPRIIVSLIILLVTILFTLWQPQFLIKHFMASEGDPLAQLLTRLWIVASLLITIAVSVWIYLESERK